MVAVARNVEGGVIYRSIHFTLEEVTEAETYRDLFPDGDAFTGVQLAYSLFQMRKRGIVTEYLGGREIEQDVAA